VITAMPTSTADSERRTPIIAAASVISRIDFAPPMCALPHSTPEPRQTYVESLGLPRATRGGSLEEKSWKLEGKVAVITAEAVGLAWPQPSASWKKVRTS